MKFDSLLIKRSCPAFCIVFSHLLLKPLKLSAFSHLAGPTLLPYAQSLSMIFLAGLLALQSRYIPNPKTLLQSLLICSALILLIFMAIVPTFLAYTNYEMRLIIGFVLFISIDIITITSLHLFWSTCHSTHSPQTSQLWYPFFIWAGQLAALGAPALSWFMFNCFTFQTATSISLILFFASLSLVFAKIGITSFPLEQIPTIHSDPHTDKIASLLSNNQYVFHIALLGMIYEILRINLEYTLFFSLQTLSLGEKSSFLYLYQTCVQALGFIISSLMAYIKTIYIPLRYRLFLTPLLSIAAISVCIFNNSSFMLASSLIIMQGFYNGFHYPIKEALYVQTTIAVHQKLRPWLATFGKRCAQGLGYSLSAGLSSMPYPLILSIPLFLAGIWGYSAIAAGHYFDNRIKVKST